MTYGAALPAGAYSGSLGAYREGRRAPSNQGAAMRARAKHQAVRLGGLGALGDPNLCTDGGWIAAQSLLSSGLDMLGGALAPTGGTKAEGSTTVTGGSGGGAGYTATQAGGAVVGTWGAVCDAERAQNAQDASYRNTLLLQEQMERDRLTQERAIAANRTAAEQQLAMMMQMGNRAAPAPTASGGIDQNTLLIGGGILAALVVGVLILK